MNRIFLIIVLTAVLFAGWKQITFEPAGGIPSPMETLSTAMVDTSTGAVELAIGLVGVMVFMLGIMRVAFDGGLRDFIARMLAPVLASS